MDNKKITVLIILAVVAVLMVALCVILLAIKYGKKDNKDPYPGLPKPKIVSMDDGDEWSLVLVNLEHEMDPDFKPELTEIEPDSDIYAEPRVAQAYVEMSGAAAANGVLLPLGSGYVSREDQQTAFDAEVKTYTDQGLNEEEAQEKAAFTVLPPGRSEENYGLSVGFTHEAEDAEFIASAVYQWLREHAAEFGFIERYTAEKETVTHFKARPWHWRYVGRKAAEEMQEKGLSLEEYAADAPETEATETEATETLNTEAPPADADPSLLVLSKVQITSGNGESTPDIILFTWKGNEVRISRADICEANVTFDADGKLTGGTWADINSTADFHFTYSGNMLSYAERYSENVPSDSGPVSLAVRCDFNENGFPAAFSEKEEHKSARGILLVYQGMNDLSSIHSDAIGVEYSYTSNGTRASMRLDACTKTYYYEDLTQVLQYSYDEAYGFREIRAAAPIDRYGSPSEPVYTITYNKSDRIESIQYSDGNRNELLTYTYQPATKAQYEAYNSIIRCSTNELLPNFYIPQNALGTELSTGVILP